MSDNPTPEGAEPGTTPQQPEAAPPTQPMPPTDPGAPPAAETQPIPPAEVAPTQPVPSVAAPGAAAPTQPAAQAAPVGPPPPGVPTMGYAAPAGPPRRGPSRLWHEATSTTGGRVATILAVVLAAVAVVAVIGLGAAAIGGLHLQRTTSVARGNGPLGTGQGPGMRGFGDNGTMPFDRQGQSNGGGTGRSFGGQGGLGGLGAAQGLGGILHGEFVTGGTGSSATTMLIQVGRVTAYTKGSSLAVTSSDGFAATYAINSSSRLVGGGTGLTVGDQVRVIATKDGATVTTVQLLAGSGVGGSGIGVGGSGIGGTGA